MNKYISSVNVEYKVDRNNLNITIKDTEGNITEFTRSPSKNGVFSFQYKHPEDNAIHNYKGHMFTKEVVIYPVYGVAVISNKPIKIKLV